MKFKDLNSISSMNNHYRAKSLPELQEAIEEYGNDIKNEYGEKSIQEAKELLISELNFRERGHLKSCRRFGMFINPGDLCYVDFGSRAFITEAGFQHFALVLSVCCGKAFVVPMTSKSENYETAYDEVDNPTGNVHLMKIGLPKGLNRYSVLFLNDAKYINTARIIDVKGHIDTDGELFRKIKKRVIDLIYKG